MLRKLPVAAALAVVTSCQPSCLRAHDTEETDLWQAARVEDATEVVRLLTNGADPNERDDIVKATPLHFAAEAGSEEIARILLEAGANVDLQDIGGQTSLHRAAGNDLSGKVVELLLRHHADPTIRDNLGDTPFLTAVRAENSEATMALLRARVPIEQRNLAGETGLHIAAREHLVEITRWLLRHGASPIAKDNEGQTPIDKARQAGNPNIVEILENELR